MKKNKFLFLGTGASTGVPVVGCDCRVCQSDSPYNKRLRPSALIKIGDEQILVDPGPDFRDQALAHKINRLSGVIITHVHYDHIGGLDELRIFYFIQQKPVECMLSYFSMEEIRLRYFYQFIEPKKSNSKTVRFNYTVLPNRRGEVNFQGLDIRYMTYYQGDMPVTGLRMGNLAYISDIKHYPESIFEDLKGVETLVVSGLRYTESPVHFNIPEAIAFAEKIGPKKVYLNHIGHELDHHITNQNLPEGFELSYDGLELEF